MTSTRPTRRALLAAMALAATLVTAGLPTGARADELSLETINAMDQASFVETFGGIFEKSPWVAEQGWEARPFDSIDDLHADLYAVIANAPREDQVTFLNQHPELAGKEAQAGTMTANSVAEQASAGLNALTPEEMQTLAEGNAAYRAKFGFPFMIFVRGHTKEGIFFYLDRRQQNDPSTDEELHNAMMQVWGITRSRVQRAVSGS
ncbi:2-oxo-4-hydroxy-4-carboxy-5-ureidoimidazoline decarboxylase [Amaricoccus sp.]|uniref:2-oxo-4-hydroxy-4-carboxy-5-ureidoimidazoline decarboxylase n=1 Tax=Amaricoccus sp. TaxID=1872485 RepID=UPI0026298DA1|nr:2-oxo-4-hydroxy-4-carboxy-5-ureidoimidazoline decarboxylase [Amaricoccus sp.]HRO11240.1 2-oxo-4-hydroxy-4-carboxy-5-ureidoimidazoline decarboxylase [Amaricoccus sp.]